MGTEDDEAMARRLQAELQAEWETHERAEQEAAAALAAELEAEEARLAQESTEWSCGTPASSHDEDAALARRLQIEEEEQERARAAARLKVDAALARQLSIADLSIGGRQRLSQKERRRQEFKPGIGRASSDDSLAGTRERVLFTEHKVLSSKPAWTAGMPVPKAVFEPPKQALNHLSTTACAQRTVSAPFVCSPSAGGRSVPASSLSQSSVSSVIGHAGRVSLLLVVDGANVARRYDGKFRARSLQLCLDFWRQAGVKPECMCVTLNESHWDESDPDLCAMESAKLIAWTPTGKDDDLFTIQTAEMTGAWIVSNDRFRNYSRWTRSVGRRLLPFSFATADVFIVAPDDVDAFLRSVGLKSM